MAAREVYWHLPGFCYFRLLNQVIINMMKDYPDRFREGYRIGSVYGTFPGAIWNGGRVSFGLTSKRDMENILKIYNSRGIPVRFTWTNSLLEEKHLQDTYCNLIMRLADNGLNQVLVNTPVLEDYIRREYPRYPLISSTTKRITDQDSLQAELDRDYYLVVLDYDLNHDWQVLETIAPQAEHYRQQSQLQLEFDINTGFPCPNQTRQRTFAECMERPAFITNEQLGSYIDKGFCNFKIAGRGMPQDYVKESYLYFLVRDEHRAFIREKVDGLLAQFKAAQQGIGHKKNI